MACARDSSPLSLLLSSDPTLQELFASESLPDDLRYLAIITVKNTLDRGWVKTITSLGEGAMQQRDAEKKHIRARMLSMFSIANIKVRNSNPAMLHLPCHFDVNFVLPLC